MPDLQEFLAAALLRRKSDHLYRQRPLIKSPQSATLDVDDGVCVNFSSNDYLGLANHPQVIARFREVADKFGVGSGASHLVSGHSFHHHALEEELAAWLGRERALLFSTGYMANLGLIDALLDKGDTLLQDKLNHASLIDAGRLTRAQFKRYRSADSAHLDQLLAGVGEGKKLVATDGVFSMDGCLAPLQELAAKASRYQAWLMVDDAHGLGVLGKQGGGVVEHFGLGHEDVPILMGTLGKAFGTFGAFVAGSEALIEYLIQFARTYIYTTALPPAVAAATRTSLKLVQQEAWRREKLQVLIARFRQGMSEAGLQLVESLTPIQPVILGSEQLTMSVAKQLKNRGYLVGAIRPPTVAKGTARLRITLSANHTELQVDGLVEAIAHALQKQRVAG